jgi:hypothetical protein
MSGMDAALQIIEEKNSIIKKLKWENDSLRIQLANISFNKEMMERLEQRCKALEMALVNKKQMYNNIFPTHHYLK